MTFLKKLLIKTQTPYFRQLSIFELKLFALHFIFLNTNLPIETFDNTFENGVAFFYIFIVNDKEIKIRSINNVYDNDKLTLKERRDIYRFWVDCKPIDKELEK